MIPHIPVLPRVDSLSCARCRISMLVILMNSQVPISGDISARFLQAFKSISKPLALSIICSMVPWYHFKLYNFLSLLLRVSPYVISTHTSPVFFNFNPSISPWLCQITCLASQIWQGSSCGLPYLACHLTRKAERTQHRFAPLWGRATQVCRELLAYQLAPCSYHIQTRLRTVHTANPRSAQKAGCYQPITRKDWGWSAPVYFSACLPHLTDSHLPAVYTLTVRSSEYDLPPEILDDIVVRSISRFSNPSHKRVSGFEDGSDNDEGWLLT